MFDNEALATLVGETPTWQPTDGYSAEDCLFNANHVLHAFEEGKQKGFVHGVHNLEQAVSKLQKVNQHKVAQQCEVVLTFLSQHELRFNEVYLQTIDWNEMNVIVFVEEQSYLRDELEEVYGVTQSIEAVQAESGLNLTFAFAPASASFDKACLNADGYTLRLKKKDVTNMK